MVDNYPPNSGVRLTNAQIEDLQGLAPDYYQAELIRKTMARGLVVVIAHTGFSQKEERLANWIRRRGGKAQIISELVFFPRRTK